MLAVDTHSHLAPPSYLEALRAYAPGDPTFAARNRFLLTLDPDSPLCRVEVRIGEMDGAEVSTSLLSLPPPGVQFGGEGAHAAVAARANDEFLEAAQQSPGRFAVLLALPLPDVGACLAELERVGGDPAVAGVGLLTTASPWTLDEERFTPVFEAAAAAGLPLVLHPALDPLPPAFSAFGIESSLGPVISSSVGALRMIFAGVFDRVPGLAAVVPHLGGTIPYLAQRVVDLSRDVHAEKDLVSYCRERLYFDTCSFHRPAFRCAVETVGVERLVLGSDYPYRGTLRRAVDDVVTAGLGPDETDAVLALTARRLFGL